jgi:predicted ATP-dependent serine protease
MIEKEVLSKIGLSRIEELTMEDLVRYHMSVSDVYEGHSSLLSYKGKCFLVKGDITAVKGRAKSGKTHFLAVLIAAILRGRYAEYLALESNLKILHIDTEQGMLNFQSVIKKALRLAGLPKDRDCERLNTYNLRELSAKNRIQAVGMLVEAYCPDVLIIDGVRDLLSDFNDIGQSSEVVNFLMAISKQKRCAIITVLHENKADNNMRGHLGTELLNKASEVFQVQRSGDDERSFYKVTQTDTRNLPVEDFTFTMGENGLPIEVVISPQLSVSDKKEIEIGTNMSEILRTNDGMTYGKLKDLYMERFAVADRTARNHIKIAQDNKVILRDENGLYHKRIYV